MPAGKASQLLQTRAQGFGIGHLAAIGENGQRFHTEFHANDWPAGGVWLRPLLGHVDRNVPPPCTLAHGRLRLFRAHREIAMLLETEGAQARKLDALFTDMDSPRQAEAPQAFFPTLDLGIATPATKLALFLQGGLAEE